MVIYNRQLMITLANREHFTLMQKSFLHRDDAQCTNGLNLSFNSVIVISSAILCQVTKHEHNNYKDVYTEGYRPGVSF